MGSKKYQKGHIRDWEKAAQAKGWDDGGIPSAPIGHPDHREAAYYSWSQCCLAQDIKVDWEMNPEF